MVKLETTKDRRRLHIGSFFTDLNETDYQELIRIFANENVVKNNLVLADVIKSVCDRCDGKPETECKILCDDCNVDLHGM